MEHEVWNFIDFKLKTKFVLAETPSQKPERVENTQFPEEVIVFTLESSDNDCPGMLPEEKVSYLTGK
jgi:hypothetical protein